MKKRIKILELPNTQKYSDGGNIADFEAEGGEVIEHIDDIPTPISGGKLSYLNKKAKKITGKTHENGGVQMKGGERIYSDRLKPYGSKKTFAQLASKIAKNIGELEKGDPISIRTAEVLKMKMDNLFNHQEQLKAAKEQTMLNKMTKKYAKGGKVLGAGVLEPAGTQGLYLKVNGKRVPALIMANGGVVDPNDPAYASYLNSDFTNIQPNALGMLYGNLPGAFDSNNPMPKFGGPYKANVPEGPSHSSPCTDINSINVKMPL